MSISVVVFLVGAAFLAAGLVGGGLKIGAGEGTVTIPSMTPIVRVLAFLIGAGFIAIGLGRELSPPPAPRPSEIDAIAGRWVGSSQGGSTQSDITFVMGNACSLGSVCGTFDIPALPCSGTVTITNIQDGKFEFQANDKKGYCGTPTMEYLQLLPDGTLLYVSIGDYGESRAVLQKVK